MLDDPNVLSRSIKSPTTKTVFWDDWPGCPSHWVTTPCHRLAAPAMLRVRSLDGATVAEVAGSCDGWQGWQLREAVKHCALVHGTG